MTKKSGFTLAEVLITLGIIGVVAAMTIPTLMNSTNQAEFKTGFKKIMSTLNQAVTMNVALESVDFSALTTGTTSSTQSVLSMFVNRMNVMKTTSVTTDTQVTQMGTPFTGGTNYALFFNDGMAISYPTGATACTTRSAAGGICTMVVDVNGAKKPNRLSLATTGGTAAGVFDQFVLDFYNQQVLPRDEKARFILYN